MKELILSFFLPVSEGGFIAFFLLALGFWLWFELGYQYFTLSEGGKEMGDKLRFSRQFSKSIVVISPLLGLLGTVIGMIETFESLGSQSLYTQTGGIAAGISQALITTQMGLLVAIPGLFIGRFLDKKMELVHLKEAHL